MTVLGPLTWIRRPTPSDCSRQWMLQSTVHHDAMVHPHSTHLCVPVLVRVLFFLVVLSEMQFSSAFPINSWHTSPSVLFSLLEGVSGQLGYAFPFHSCGLISYPITLQSRQLPHLLLTCTLGHASYTVCPLSVLGSLWGFHDRTYTCHFESYHCILHRPIYQSISDSILYRGHAELPMSAILHSPLSPVFTWPWTPTM